MRILKDLPELLQAEVITPDTADKIRDYYKSKSRSSTSTNPLFIVFGILGALLIGLGIILIMAHNWDELSRSTKTILSFLPLLIGQGICAYVLIKKQDSRAWRESGSAFLFFAVGASIALVSQIYNIPGGSGTFLFTWMLLCLPLVYILKSSITSLLYISGSTYYATQIGYWSNFTVPYLYWLLLIGVLPHYYQLYQLKPNSNFTTFHHWLAPVSLTIALGTVAQKADELLFIAYFGLFSSFYMFGDLKFLAPHKLRNNGYKVIGTLGTMALLLVLSFNWLWDDLQSRPFPFNQLAKAPEFYASVITSLVATGLLYFSFKNKPLSRIQPLAPGFLFFIFLFVLGHFSPAAVVLINVYILLIGVLTVKSGVRQNHLGLLNLGLLLITALVVCRFFDTDLSFVIRGILFVLVGLGFFMANYWLLQKRKTHEY
ncbi:DUF2157 domain-containing protein [Adhaeribacter pallidiroseus]|uniref:DUF2157 domain-containing protein n=1 Tax=Adhaeribacter pallidiroseus TaxID=2072847 RepID=A0A369QH91_9BACT|nr:DUF2157 domain-containing protein [Adhaeribacter pallidiroseus]RDC64293.1 hypothetical protein AHMF7616_02906 [Adhaeribacter pallidiroseus]